MDRRNAGFTLIELLVTMVLGTIILTAVYRTLSAQRMVFSHEDAVIESHEASRITMDLLASELREISSSGADLLMATPDSVTMRALRKIGLACYVPSSSSLYVDLWTLGAPFEAADRVLIYDNGGTSQDPRDDRWVARKVVSADSSSYNTTGCTEWPELSLRGDSVGDYTRQHLVITGTTLGTIAAGAPVRSYEIVTYAIEQVDGEWMLTRRVAGGSTVPLVGPLAAPADSGLVLTYFDASGAQIATSSLASNLTGINSFRVDVKGMAVASGGAEVERALSILVYLRNNDPRAMGW